MSTRSLVLLVCQFRHFRVFVIARDDFLIITKKNKNVKHFFNKNCKKLFKIFQTIKTTFFKKSLDLFSKSRYNIDCSQKWRNWQTRRLQVPVVAISCGFKSHLLHRKSLDHIKAFLLSKFNLYDHHCIKGSFLSWN